MKTSKRIISLLLTALLSLTLLPAPAYAGNWKVSAGGGGSGGHVGGGRWSILSALLPDLRISPPLAPFPHNLRKNV